MEQLVHSGLPLYLDETSLILAISASLKLESYSRKVTGDMKGLLACEQCIDAKTPFYDVYRDIAYPKDQALFQKYGYRYDITVILPGLAGGECKKTSGHYHGFNPTHTNTYGEVYEVLKGNALYILQKCGDFESHPDRVKIEDLYAVRVNEGQSIIIPPNYGHASINIGYGPLIFSNLALISCPVLYDAIKSHQGMAYYVFREEGRLRFHQNPHYEDLPKLKNAVVRQNPALGIEFGKPVYQSFVENPQAFDFLANPDPYIDAIMELLMIT